MVNIRNITEYKQLQNLGEEWESLLSDLHDNTTIFSGAEWYETWLKHFSTGVTLTLLTLWDTNKLVGVAPLMKTRIRLHGLPVTAIGFIENRNSLHNDFIVLPAYRDVFLREVLQVLLEQSTQWDILRFNNLSVTSPNYAPLVKMLDEMGRKWCQGPSFNSPFLLPTGSWTEYLASRSTRTRKSLRNTHNSLHKAGEVSVKNIRTWEDFQLIKDELYQVAKQSWTEKIGDSLATPENQLFFDDLASSVAARGWLSVWTLSLNNRMIAFEFHLQGCGKDHALRGSYLPEFAHLSPGTYLEMQILKQVFDGPEQIQKYDFGGSFDSYKRKWTEEATPHCELLIFNNDIYSRFAAFHEMKTVPLLKLVRDKLKRAGAR